MSKAKLPLEEAERLAQRRIDKWSPTGEGHVAGSIRRRKELVGDIEILLPMPASGEPDAVHEKMKPDVMPRTTPEGMFERLELEQSAGPDGRWAQEIKGFKPGFRYCQLHVDPVKAWGKRFPAFNIDVFRYDRGPEGNLGGVMLVRTGSLEFSKAVAMHWQRLRGRMRHNYFIDGDGAVARQDTEERVFELLGLEWIEPERRHGRNQVIPLARRATA